MQTITNASSLRAVIDAWRAQGLTVGLVPTMGNLHAGHISLVEKAKIECDRVVASIFVNPTQFGPDEDFARYPRTLDTDSQKLRQQGCDVVFAPSVDTMYPFGIEQATQVHVKGVTNTLEGRHRPGHFDGVCTVVLRLFNLVQPDVAVFGQKDYQQLLVIRRMVTELSLPITIVSAPIVRESDGLALSSRNQYLLSSERPYARLLLQTLQAMQSDYRQRQPLGDIEDSARRALQEAGFVVDYAAIRQQDDLAPPDQTSSCRLIALIAAHLGHTRLIDNLILD